MSGLTPQQNKKPQKKKTELSEPKTYTFEELKAKLTQKEKIFCHEYIVDWNGSRAARKAGYSETSCRDIASENLTKPHIKQYVAFIKDNLEEEAGISKLRNLKELAKIAYSNISHLHDSWIELTDWEQIKEENPDCLAAVESIDTKTETRSYPVAFGEGDVRESEVETKYVKIKLYSKQQAIQMINEMMGYKAPVKAELKVENLDYLDELLKQIKK